MNPPLKPWEVPGLGMGMGMGISDPNPLSYVSNTNTRLQSSAVPFLSSGGGGGGGGSSSQGSTPPPLPPRPGQQTRPIYSASSPYSYPRTGMMPYSSYNNSPMYNNGYSSPYYNSYNQYPTNYSAGMGIYGNRMYGPPPGGDALTFAQLAEESSAPTFQSIDSFVSAFGSINMALESTFHAVYSSFRAVVGVADHLGRMKQVLSELSIFRYMRRMLRRILYLIGLSKIKPEQLDTIWNSSADAGVSGTDLNLNSRNQHSRWPIVMFLGFISLGPYLIWKLFRSVWSDDSNVPKDSKWASGEAEHFLAVAEHDFETTLSERELRIKRGQSIRLAPASEQPPGVQGWVMASDGVKIGLVPVNYIKVLGKRSGSLSQPPIPSSYTGATNINTTSYMSSQPELPPLAQLTTGHTPSISRSSSESTLKGSETPMTKSFTEEE